MPWIEPDWPVPAHVKSASTTRDGGVSKEPYDSLNLGTHVEDDLESVLQNRKLVRETLKLPSEPLWLEQIHSDIVADADSDIGTDSPLISADASVSHRAGKVCVVMTADCLPVLMTDTQGTVIGAAHAGWRGLNDGILEATIKQMKVSQEDIMIWLGPAIGPDNFEVGEEVREAFVATHQEAENAFVAGVTDKKWYADIYKLARIRLVANGILDKHIYGGGFCTYSDHESDHESDQEADQHRFFSYRRQNKTGRMASLIWLDETN